MPPLFSNNCKDPANAFLDQDVIHRTKEEMSSTGYEDNTQGRGEP